MVINLSALTAELQAGDIDVVARIAFPLAGNVHALHPVHSRLKLHEGMLTASTVVNAIEQFTNRLTHSCSPLLLSAVLVGS